MMMPSEPTQPVAAAAMAMDWGEVTLPTVAPAALAATSHSWLSPSAEAVCACRALNRVQEEVTLPVMKVPMPPMMGANRGYREPVRATMPVAISATMPA